jgi:hypothetical protein
MYYLLNIFKILSLTDLKLGTLVNPKVSMTLLESKVTKRVKLGYADRSIS